MALNLIKTLRDGTSPPGFLDGAASPPTGFSLAEVAAMATELDLAFRPAFRPPGSPIPTPAVIHWKLDHYGALVDKQGDRYLLRDSTFKTEQWISQAVLEEEASGYFLVPALPEGWREVGREEASGIFGKGITSDGNDEETDECAETTGGGCAAGCGKGDAGMAQYRFHTMLAGLTVFDTPMVYEPAFGPGVDFRIRYNEREIQPSTLAYTNFSPQWEMRWVAYVEDDPSNPASTVTVNLPGGGHEKYSNYNVSTGEYGKHRRSGAVLVRIGSGQYERRFPDGSKEVYHRAIGSSGPNRKVFLSQYVDPQGNAVSLSYDTDPQYPARILEIVDATGPW